MAKEKLFPKKGLFGTTVYVNKQGEFVGKSRPDAPGNLIRGSDGRVVGKSYGSIGIGFSSDKKKR